MSEDVKTNKDKEAAHVPDAQLSLLGDNDQSTRQEEATPKGCTRNIHIFVAHLCLLNLTRMALRVYYGGTIRTVERRFGFRSADTGLFASVNDIGHIALVLFFGYFGRIANKPRLIGSTVLFAVVAGYLHALPYFLLPTAGISVPLLENNYSYSLNGSLWGPHLKSGPPMCDGDFHGEDCTQEGSITQQSRLAYVTFLVANILIGISGPASTTLGLPYIDENTERAKTPFLIAIVSASFSLGPVVGLLMASFCTRLPEDLFGSSNLKPSDPNFIGAWWLGYGILSTILLLLTLGMFWYPKHMTAKAAAIAQSKEAKERTREGKGLWEQLKGFPPAIKDLLCNLPFVVMLVSDIFVIYMLAGVFFNIPRYLESHFLLPAFQANIIAALSSAFMGLIGALIGGFIMTRLRLKTVGLSKMMLLSSFSKVIGLVIMLSMSCPSIDLAGDWNTDTNEFSVDTWCNRNCSCLTSKKAYQPVCGVDEYTYFSPCHAGCSESSNGTFYDCGCIEGGTARPGLCLGTCKLLVPFAVTLALVSFISALGRPADVVITMRVVPETERPLGLGLISFVNNLLAMMPGPVLFGYLIDTACVLWQKICGQRGNCLLYDPDKFRWRTYGVSFVFVAVHCVLVCFLCYLIKQRASKFDPVVHQVEITAEVDKRGGEEDRNGFSQKTLPERESVV